MRIERLYISNFRGVALFEIENLATMVVVAGPNGCGKSSVFDAIRLLKSVYGGYQQDEWRSWFGEFQINLSHKEELRRLLRDETKPAEIWADFSLADAEVDYINHGAEAVLEPLAWQEVIGRDFDFRTFGSPALATELRVHGERVKQLIDEGAGELRKAVAQGPRRARLTLTQTLDIHVHPNRLLEVIFRTFDPEHLGIIDYHGPMRMYQREAVGGLSLNLDSFAEQRRNQSLYNWQGKYSNVKSELASNYVRELIAAQAGAQSEHQADLNATLSELFQTFFPDKSYDGPRPTVEGTPLFPVRLTTGEEHDIDDLSSGEKEVLYGYLRLRNSAPQNSVILLDEPELHLNPDCFRVYPTSTIATWAGA
jgi:energy-coupling factor transporter ATP-binding protein EcfA2